METEQLDYKTLLGVLKNRSFIIIDEIKKSEILVENVAFIMAVNMNKIYQNNLKNSKQSILFFLENFSTKISELENDFDRKDIYNKMRCRLIEKKASYAAFTMSPVPNPLLYQFHVRICLNNDFIEENDFIILTGTVLENKSFTGNFINQLDSGVNAKLAPSSKIVLIYRVCPLDRIGLVKNNIIRLYNDYTVIHQSICGYDYFVWDGYNVCFDSKGIFY